MDSSSTADAKKYAMPRIAERLAAESESLPYRWGYFQGAILIPWSLLVVLGTLVELLKLQDQPWYLITIQLLMGLLGLPLAVGLLRKRRFGLMLVHAMFGLSLLQVGIKVPIAIGHFADPGDIGSGMFEAEQMMVWLISLQYYRRRKRQFQ
jgi:hypothetical protein